MCPDACRCRFRRRESPVRPLRWFSKRRRSLGHLLSSRSGRAPQSIFAQQRLGANPSYRSHSYSTSVANPLQSLAQTGLTRDCTSTSHPEGDVVALEQHSRPLQSRNGLTPRSPPVLGTGICSETHRRDGRLQQVPGIQFTTGAFRCGPSCVVRMMSARMRAASSVWMRSMSCCSRSLASSSTWSASSSNGSTPRARR